MGYVFDFTSNSIILLIVYSYHLCNVIFFCLLLTAFNTHIRVMMNTLIRVLPVTLIRVSSNNLYVVYHSLVVLILYILFSIAIVACVLVPRFLLFCL